MNFVSNIQLKTILTSLLDKIDAGASEEMSMHHMMALLDMLGIPVFRPLEMPSGTIWSTRNVGAPSVLDCGEYYAFGEPYAKSDYVFRNYLQIFSPVKITDKLGAVPVHYYDVPAQCSTWRVDKAADDDTKPDAALVASRGIITSGGWLKHEFDIATLTEGDGYGMPTKYQVEELWDNTAHTYDSASNSIMFTANNGNIIFPCSGCKSEERSYTNPLGTDDGVGFGLWVIDGYGTDEPSNINGFDYYGEFASITCRDGVNVELEWVKDGGAYRGLTVRPVSPRESNEV